LMLHELRKVIPSFLRRVDLPERGGRWTTYLATTRQRTAELVESLFADEPPATAATVTLVDFDPDAENKLLAAICYPHSHLPEQQLLDKVARLGAAERLALIRAYVGERENRRHKPGRAFERIDYRFDVLADYGAFRDLQRHRLLTIEWQALSPRHGYIRPELVDAAGQAPVFDEAMHRSARLYDALTDEFPEQAPYAVSMAYRLRFVMQFNAREAIHLLELRSGAQGHPAYRRVVLDMHRLIAEQAGHRVVAEAMTHLTTDEPELARLASERRAETRRGS
jgi:Thymidylate synthase complementing protein